MSALTGGGISDSGADVVGLEMMVIADAFPLQFLAPTRYYFGL